MILYNRTLSLDVGCFPNLQTILKKAVILQTSNTYQSINAINVVLLLETVISQTLEINGSMVSDRSCILGLTKPFLEYKLQGNSNKSIK